VSWRIGVLAACVLLVVPAGAAHGAVLPTREPEPLAAALRDGVRANGVAGFDALPPNGSAPAVVDGPLAGFPVAGPTASLLTTGDPSRADDPNDGNVGADLGGSARGAFDVTVLRVPIAVPDGANCLSFRFRFLSEEYPEYVGGEYNDAFIAELDESNWSVDGSAITAPRNFAFAPGPTEISINATGPAAVSREEAAGTTYDAATAMLFASTPVTPGAHTLFLSIFDQGDGALDSAVLVDELITRTAPPEACRAGAQREQTPPPAPQPPPPAAAQPPAPPPLPPAVGSVALEGGSAVLRGSGTFSVGPSPDGSQIVFGALGGSVAAGPGCTALGAGRVGCARGAATAISAQLGPGNDTLDVTGPLPVPLSVAGGNGDDELLGPLPGAAPGREVTLLGGPGDDRFRASGAGPSTVDGGAGDDAVFAPERALRGTQLVVRGGEGADRVATGGSELRKEVDGGPGDDVVDVRGGAGVPDTVACAGGRDAVSADDDGPGRDRLVGCEQTVDAVPELGRTVVLETLSGIVRFARTDESPLARLRGEREVPVATVVDAARGVVQLAAAAAPSVAAPGAAPVPGGRVSAVPGALRSAVSGVAQVAAFSLGAFDVRQRAATGLTELRLRGRLARCRRLPRAGARPPRGAPPFRRRLRGDGRGVFRIVGQRASAGPAPGASAARALWTVEDRCDGSTRVSVARGSVTVEDRGRRRTVTLRAGRSYTAVRRSGR